MRNQHTFSCRRILPALLVVLLFALLLSACGKSEFALVQNEPKAMTLKAENAAKDSFFLSGTLEVAEGEQVVIASDLKKGEIKIELLSADGSDDINTLPDVNGEAVVMFKARSTDRQAHELAAGGYLLRATCLEKASGTVQIEVIAA